MKSLKKDHGQPVVNGNLKCSYFGNSYPKHFLQIKCFLKITDDALIKVISNGSQSVFYHPI